MTHIGVLTAGGDCPGLNAAIRGVVARAVADGVQVSGVADGWAGLMDGRVGPLGRDDVRGILTRGGTILGTSRTDPYEHATITSNTYWDWYFDHVYLLVPMQEYVGTFLATFKEYPPRQKAASFTVDQVMEQLERGLSGGK